MYFADCTDKVNRLIIEKSIKYYKDCYGYLNPMKCGKSFRLEVYANQEKIFSKGGDTIEIIILKEGYFKNL